MKPIETDVYQHSITKQAKYLTQKPGLRICYDYYSQKAAAIRMVYCKDMDNTWHFGMILPTTSLLDPSLGYVAHSFRIVPYV